MADVIIDPLEGPRYGVHGRVVTMNDAHDVMLGTIWIDAGVIVAITSDGAPVPDGFADVRVLRTGGTIYPGMIELHNHLPYNVLGMWTVPRLYGNRGQWGSHPDYRRLVSGPMKVLGKTAGYIEAVIRYVEVKALVAGVTTSQGVALYSNANTRRFHRGLVRNVEETNDPALPEADSRIADIDADDAGSFLERLERGKKVVLHLAEGVDTTAREHFQALQLTNDRWAITDALIGIHAAGLTATDFDVYGKYGAAMVWSPASNLMLYGGTARVDAARRAGVTVALGSDWSPTGSKNLLAELKVARAAATAFGWDITDRDLVDMVTRNPAQALGWDHALGSLGPGYRADLMVVHGRDKDPYRRLLEATERSVILVIVNGVPRYGQSRFLTEESEPIQVGGSTRHLFLGQQSVDPVVAAVSFGEAVDRLKDGLARLAELAHNLEDTAGIVVSALGGSNGIAMATPLGIERARQRWVLELADEEPDATTTTLALGPNDQLAPPTRLAVAAQELSKILGPLNLDPLTVIDDPGYRARLTSQPNLPPNVAALL